MFSNYQTETVLVGWTDRWVRARLKPRRPSCLPIFGVRI